MPKTYNPKIQKALYNYFTDKWHLKSSRNGWIRGDCPFCQGNNCFGVNPSNHRINCFKKCGCGTDPIRGITQLEGFTTISQTITYLNGFDWGEYKAPIQKKVKKKKVVLPEHHIPIILGDDEWAKRARAYLEKKRRLKVNNLALKGWGYCSEGEYKGRIIMPYYKKGELIYFTSRQFINLQKNKFKNPAFEDFGIGKEMVIYNEDALYLYRKCYVVESIMNAETLGDKAIAIGGKSISAYQKNIIMDSPVESLVIILDPDAKKEAFKLALDLIIEKRIKILQLLPPNDVNDLGKKAILEMEKSSRYLSYAEVYSLYIK